jgi:hypothetical protein
LLDNHPWTVVDYAIRLVTDGIESHAEDDLDEDGLLPDEEQHTQAVDLALWIARAIRVEPRGALDLVVKVYPDIPLAKVLADS